MQNNANLINLNQAQPQFTNNLINKIDCTPIQQQQNQQSALNLNGDSNLSNSNNHDFTNQDLIEKNFSILQEEKVIYILLSRTQYI